MFVCAVEAEVIAVRRKGLVPGPALAGCAVGADSDGVLQVWAAAWDTVVEHRRASTVAPGFEWLHEWAASCAPLVASALYREPEGVEVRPLLAAIGQGMAVTMGERSPP